jgi:DNA-binding IscR family transcriptional regulator
MLMIAELMQANLPMQSAIVNCIGIDKDKLESILLRFDFGGLITSAKGKAGNGEYVLL